jgi:hypothetical protein
MVEDPEGCGSEEGRSGEKSLSENCRIQIQTKGTPTGERNPFLENDSGNEEINSPRSYYSAESVQPLAVLGRFGRSAKTEIPKQGSPGAVGSHIFAGAALAQDSSGDGIRDLPKLFHDPK